MNSVDIDDEIEQLKKERTQIESSQMSDGLKTDILKVLDNAATSLHNIKPFYEHLDSIKEFILAPTKENIEKSFKKFNDENSILNKRNTIFNIISFIFGIVGLVGTIYTFKQPSVKDLEHATINNIENLYRKNSPTSIDCIKDFGWLTNITYDNSSESLALETFHFSIMNNVIDLTLYNKNHTPFSQREINSIISCVLNIILSCDSKFNRSNIDILENSFNDDEYLPQTNLKISIKNFLFPIDKIIISSDKKTVYFCPIKKDVKDFRDSIKDITLNKQQFVIALSNFLYYLSGNNYKLDTESYINNSYINISDIDGSEVPYFAFIKSQ